MYMVDKFYRVYDKYTRAPVVGAEVRAENPFGDRRGDSGKTDRDGEAKLKIDFSSSQYVYIKAKGYHPVKDMKARNRYTLVRHYMTPLSEPEPPMPEVPWGHSFLAPTANIPPWDREDLEPVSIVKEVITHVGPKPKKKVTPKVRNKRERDLPFWLKLKFALRRKREERKNRRYRR